ncbi:hypothetical protein QA601_00850 [Chitinispirillales bacterium ANBcel5]|uniref:hypothetical protein n=1 Tax=Cellulosispirillum alkaliphilum TaxID=3039283 RepID=UPI002A536814|nr:hypothetical protein [Chitinispirillales bacterium ANBcel5]
MNVFRSVRLLLVAMLFLYSYPAWSNEEEGFSYKIEKPGTITFTVGAQISADVHKPQVIIFLPKEEIYYRDIKMTHSFTEQISKPLSLKRIRKNEIRFDGESFE